MQFALGSGYTLDGSGYRRDTEPGYVKEARAHKAKGRKHAKRGAAIVALNPEGAYIVAGVAIGGAIGGPPGAAVGTRVGATVGFGVTLVGVGYLVSGAYHYRAARRTQRRGARQAQRAVRRDVRRRYAERIAPA